MQWLETAPICYLTVGEVWSLTLTRVSLASKQSVCRAVLLIGRSGEEIRLHVHGGYWQNPIVCGCKPDVCFSLLAAGWGCPKLLEACLCCPCKHAHSLHL